uniref:IPT/TIG domain-containing protein n=1 Tax=Cryptomonas curvata TaxID=233186 RepID=A0A7S0QNM0_9CRYP
MPGPVDFGLGINAMDFCYLVAYGTNKDCVRSYKREVGSDGVVIPQPTLWPDEKRCQCLASYGIALDQLPKVQKFVYHDAMQVLNIVPPSGIESGGTEILLHGKGFKNYGQALFVYFGVPPTLSNAGSSTDFRVAVPATILSSSVIKCLAPARPVDTISDSQSPPGTYAVFIKDVAVPVQVSSNGLQFTAVQDGSACVQNAANAISRDNKKAQCILEFVMYTWFSLPEILGVVGPVPAENIYPKLANAAPSLYDSLSIMTQNIPQGLVTGSTKVTLLGNYFVSMARAEVVNGQGTSVECSGAASGGVVPPGKSCTTTCVFPFAASITGPGIKVNPPYPYYYGCVNLPFTITQQQQTSYWCAVQDQPPAIFNGKYGYCRNDISIWKDYNQGGKVISSLECRFGDIHVPATVVPLAATSTQNPELGRQITCESPPYQFGIMVPLSVTLNRVDYSAIQPFTYFQYLKPAPVPVEIKINPSVSQFTLIFDGETNMAGQRLNEQVFCETMKIFADGNLPVPDKNFIGLGGMFSSPPLCQWIDRVSLSVQLGIDFSLENGTMIPFKKIPCDIGSSADCWRWDYFKTLRLQDDHTTDVLSKETGNVGCRYPRHPSLPGSQECSSSVIQSTAPGWCGACLPTSNEVTQLSLPFNRSISHLSFTIAKKAVLAPVPVIVGPSSVDNCESRCYQGSLSGKVCTFNSDCPGGTCKISLVRFDATTSVGDLGKPFQKIVWSLDANPKYVQDIDPPITSQYYNMETGTSTRMLANQYLTPTFFPSSAQKVAARYCFILTLTNWLGGVGVSANCFVLSLSIGIPVPQIVMSEGGSMTSFTKSKDLILSANVGFSACAAGKTFTASFQWSISPDVTLLPSPTIDFMVPKLLIRAYSVPFVSNQQYTFTFNATMSDSSFGTSSSTKQITLKCIPSPPTVNIEGGLVQTYSPAHGPLIIDASRSFDTDKIIDNRSPRDLLFCWKCSVVFRDCRWTTNSNVSIDRLNTSILTIAPGSIDLNATYTVDLSVYQRTVSDLSCQSVSLTSIPKTAVSIVLYTTKNAPKVSVSYPRTRFVSASSQFRISGTIYFGTTGDNLQTCGCMYSWKVVPQLPIVFMKGVSGVSCGRVDLMVSSGAFSSVSALSYRVQLSATCDSTSGMAAIDIQSVTPPTSGSCGVTPTVGIAFQTLFTSSCVNWADDLDSLPIRYRFLISSVISGDRFVLAPWSENSILTTVLPSGDSGSNFALQMITEVNNNFGVVAKQFSQTITCNPRTFSGPAQVQTSLNQMSNDLSSYRLNSQDVNVMMGKIGTLALSLNDISSVASRSQLLYIQNLREQVVKTITDLSAPGHKRRLLDVSLCPTSLYSSTVAMFVSRLQLSTTTTAPDTLSMSTCDSAKQSISCYLLSGNDLGVDSEDADQVALDLFKTLTNCANQSNITELYSTLRTLSIVAMKERNSADDILRYRHRGLAMISKRYSVSDFGEKNLTIYPQINITIPGSLGREIPQSTAVDALVISMTTSQNPYKSLSNQQVFGPIAEISMHSAFQQEGTLSSIQLLYQIQNVSNIAVRDLKTPITIVFSLDTKPEFKYNHATEVFKASACSFYNTTSSLWTPFGINFAAACEPQCPWNTPSNKDLSRLVCPTTHLTAFSAVETTVGCDFVPSLIPKQTDICCLCDGAGKSCCDWRRIDSANNIASQAPCPQTDDGQGLDSCLVCQKNVESVLTKPFVSLQFKNVSGICDYRGIPCTNNMIPNACGVCDLPDNELQRKANSGLCDCDPVNPRLPNEQGGGKILDRCGICDGGNKSMDDCGTNPDIPAYDPSGLFEVCHSGGRGKTQVPRWNMACTGCDNVTRPDLPFNLSRRPYPGGVQIDKCGICGGDNSACVGCDRVPGSSKKIDFCGVCGGTNDSCIGCDKVRNPRPTVLDLCGICGGSNYGACKISYTYDFTQIIVLNLLWQNFGPSRQQILEASLVSVVQGLSGTSMVQVHIASFVTGTSAGTTQIKFKVIAPDRTAATTTLRITFRNEPSRPNTFLLDLQNAIRKAGDSDLAGSLPNAIDSQPTPQIMEDKTTFPCNYATLQPREICQMDCAGVASGGAVIDRCGVCGGDGSSCSITAECPVTNCTTCCGCDSNLQPIFPDKCGKCGGDSTSCAGCDGKPFSGKLYDFCGVCGGDNTSCIGCDGVVHSGKVKDLCGICDGGNRRRDVCGSCITDNSQGLSCAGCDGVPFSGKSIDACGVCGGTNQCKWRDGQPPADSKGSTAAVVMLVSLQT